jgi:hypothetical protein
MKLITLFIASFFLFLVAHAHASETDLLQRALTCKLQDNELSSLLQDLAKTRTDFKKPTFLYALPSIDVYQLDSAISANGYTSSQVVVAPARVLMAVPGKALKEVIATLRLEESSFFPARRVVRPTVSIIAFRLSHAEIERTILVGCEYANPEAGQWLKES